MWNLIPWKQESGNGGLTTAEPFEREFSRIRDEFDSLMRRMWGGVPGTGEDFFESRWGMDVEETDTHYIAHVPAPGFELKDFDVFVSGNHLVVKAEHKESEEGKNGRRQRYGKFQTTVPTFRQSVRLWQAQYKAAKAAADSGKALERAEGCSGQRL